MQLSEGKQETLVDSPFIHELPIETRDPKPLIQNIEILSRKQAHADKIDSGGVEIMNDLPLNVLQIPPENEMRRKKIDAIGTLLEKAVIREPYFPLNKDQNMPGIFVNTKLYGKSTEDDPVYIHPVNSVKGNPKNILKVKLDE